MNLPCFLAAALVLITSTPLALSSQSPTAERSLSVRVAAGGVGTMGGMLDQYDRGWTATIALRIRPAATIPVQLDVLRARASGDPFTVIGPADELIEIDPRVSITAVTANAMLAPWSRGSLHPYLLVGAGAYRLEPDDRVSEPGAVITLSGTTAFGVAYGGGLELAIGRMSPFLEVRHHIVFPGGGSTSFIPVTVGFTF